MTNKSILITGASSGIGRAIAEEYARPGVFLALMGRDDKRLKEVAEICQVKGATVKTVAVDVRDADRLAASIEKIDSQHPIDLVIANAGIALPGNLETTKHVQELLDVNVQGVVNTVSPLIPLMETRGHGHIALMSSLAAFRGLPGRSAYAASKAAVKAFGEAKRVELQPKGITVSIIYPGFVETPLTDKNKFYMPLRMSAPKAARIIKQGLDKHKKQITFPFIIYCFVRFLSMLPPSIADYISRFTRYSVKP